LPYWSVIFYMGSERIKNFIVNIPAY
jgi:hypothetical protein